MKKAIALIFLFSLCLSLIAGIGAFEKVGANPGLSPEEPPGAITINGDGNCMEKNIQRQGNTYTLTGNVNGPIVIGKDNIVLDGAGYIVQGNGNGVGVWLQGKSGVTIKNMDIRNFGYGIRFSAYPTAGNSSKNCNVVDNKLTNNTYGLYFSSSSDCHITSNYIADNTYGVRLYGSNVAANNRFERNQFALSNQIYSKIDLGESNTIDGKPIYYWVNQHDRTVPQDAAAVILIGCSGIRVENLALSGNEINIFLKKTDSSTITGNTLSGGSSAIVLTESSSNTISSNIVENNTDTGIGVGHYEYYKDTQSSNNKIVDNKVFGNRIGIACTDSNTISHNEVTANEHGIIARTNSKVTNNSISQNSGNGIFLKDIKDSTVSGNNITSNRGYGIGFGYGPNGKVEGNLISKNSMGIWISNAYSNTIQSNTIIENEGFGIYMEGSHHENLIYHNNFIGNNKGGTQASIKHIWFYPDAEHGYRGNDPPRLVDGAANSWDNGKEGNYWSDSTSGGPYRIDGNNQDNYPLLAPLEVSSLELPSSAFTSQESDSGSSFRNFLSTLVTIATPILLIIVVTSLCLTYLKKRKEKLS